MNKRLKTDIEDVLQKYQSLSFDEEKGIVSGNFPLINPVTGEEIESYQLKFFFPLGVFIDKIPRVWEKENKLPWIKDRHIYDNGEFCLSSNLDAYLICRKGISFLSFLENIVKPFLATQTLLSLGKIDSFPQGERSHGEQGVLESYQDYFETEDISLIIDLISSSLTKHGRNHPCICGSGKKYKRCHGLILREKPLPPRKILEKDLEDLNRLYSSNSI